MSGWQAGSSITRAKDKKSPSKIGAKAYINKAIYQIKRGIEPSFTIIPLIAFFFKYKKPDKAHT